MRMRVGDDKFWTRFIRKSYELDARLKIPNLAYTLRQSTSEFRDRGSGVDDPENVRKYSILLTRRLGSAIPSIAGENYPPTVHTYSAMEQVIRQHHTGWINTDQDPTIQWEGRQTQCMRLWEETAISRSSWSGNIEVEPAEEPNNQKRQKRNHLWICFVPSYTTLPSSRLCPAEIQYEFRLDILQWRRHACMRGEIA